MGWFIGSLTYEQLTRLAVRRGPTAYVCCSLRTKSSSGALSRLDYAPGQVAWLVSQQIAGSDRARTFHATI
jgi:hypothetical protein